MALLVSIKLGTPDRGINGLGAQHLQFVDFVKVRDSEVAAINGRPEQWALGRAAYQYVAVPDSREPLIRQLIETIVEPDGSKIRQSSEGWLDESRFLAKLGTTSRQLLDGKTKSIVDGSEWDFTDRAFVKRYSTDGLYVARSTIDLAAVTSGTFTFGGGVGDDYPDRTQSLADAGALTGNLTFPQNSATAETAQSGFFVSQGVHTFKLTSNSHPDGDVNAGYKSTQNGGANGVWFQTAGTGDIVIEHQHWEDIAGVDTGGALIKVNVTGAHTLKIIKCLLDGGGPVNNGRRGGLEINDADLTLEFSDLKIWDCWFWNMILGNFTTASKIEHCVTFGDGQGFNFAKQLTMLNCGGYTNDASFAGAGVALSTGNNTSGNDAQNEDANWNSGSGNLSSRTAGTDFVSVTDTSSDFLTIADTSGLHQAGTDWTITEAATSINDVARVLGDVDIGAHAIARAGGGAAATYYYNKLLAGN